MFVFIYGECSSVGRAPDCGSGGRGFDPHHSPHFFFTFSLMFSTLGFFSMNSFVWGVLLVLIGIELIFKSIFGISLPIFRIACGLFLIYLGSTFLTNSSHNKAHTIRFEKKTVHEIEIKQNYHVAFSQAYIDLSHARITQPIHTTITTTFGSTELILDENIPTRVTVHASFGNADLPDQTQLTFGTHTFEFSNPEEKPYLEIYAYVTFGSLSIKKR